MPAAPPRGPIRWARGFVIVFSALACGHWAPPASAASVRSLLVRNDEEAIEVVLTFPASQIGSIESDANGGRGWDVVGIDGIETTAAFGWPRLPVHTALVAVPPGARVLGVTAVPAGVRTMGKRPVVPVAMPLPHPEIPLATAGEKIEPAYGNDEPLFPADWATLVEVTWWRNRRVAVVEVHPVRTVPGEPGHVRADAIRLTVRLAPGRVPSERPIVARHGEDRMDAAIDRLLVNADASRAWLRSEAPAPSRPRRGVAGTDYFSSAPVWVKLRTEGSGIRRVTGSDLAAAGVSLPIADAASIRAFVGYATELPATPPVFGPGEWMNEIALVVEDGGDGRFDSTDRIELYVVGVDGRLDEIEPQGADSSVVQHQYTSRRAYWLSWGTGFASPTGARMSVVDAAPTASGFTLVESVTANVRAEVNRWYDPGPRETSPLRIWTKWWWNSGFSRTDGSPRGVSYDVPAAVAGAGGTVTVRLWGASTTAGILPDHIVDLAVNGVSVPEERWDGIRRRDVVLDASTEPALIRAGRNTLTLFVDPTPGETGRIDRVYLDHVSVQYRRRLEWTGAPFTFRSPAIDGIARYRITAIPSTAVEVYDVTDPQRPIRLAGLSRTGPPGAVVIEMDRPESSTARRRYLVSDPAEHARPASIVVDTPPDGFAYLRERSGPIDYIVVYYDAFESAARTIEAFRSRRLPGSSDPRVLAVRLSDVYDEFSFGVDDPTAIRNFLKFAYETYRDPSAPGTPRLRYALLIGDADFDHRDFETNQNFDYLPAWTDRYQPFFYPTFSPTWPSDDYMGLFQGPDERLPEISIGRIPAQSALEARRLADKIVDHHESPDRSAWQSRVVLVADDLCQGTRWDESFFRFWTHTRQANEDLGRELPASLEQVKIYLVDYPDPVAGLFCTGTTKPSARDALVTAINDGVMMVDYVGHGGETTMADEKVLVSQDVPSLTNRGRYHYFITASCSVGKFDDVNEGLGETIFKRVGGGSVVTLSAAAVTGSASNVALNARIFRELFRGGSTHPDSLVPFGDALLMARASQSVSLSNVQKYNIMGDPATEVAWGRHVAELGIQVAPGAREKAGGSVLYRGEVATLSGAIVDRSGAPLPAFEGVARVEIYDSAELRDREVFNVADNQGDTVSVHPIDYTLAGAPIYRGDVTVTAGAFEAPFFVPTGLRRGLRGVARIRCYVAGDAGVDAFGTIDGITIPEAVRPGSVVDDENPPTIALSFGGPTKAIPVGSEIGISLEDESGIYITGLLDARSVVLSFEEPGGFVVWREDLSDDIVFRDGFTSAVVSVPFPSVLEVGRPYVVKVAASDNAGNRARTEEEIFLVVSGAPELERVFVYPNPAARSASFFVDANVRVEVEADIYTLTGRRIRTLSATLEAGEGRHRPMYWDLRDEDGDRVANGSYHYVVSVRPTGGGASDDRTGWIAVLR